MWLYKKIIFYLYKYGIIYIPVSVLVLIIVDKTLSELGLSLMCR